MLRTRRQGHSLPGAVAGPLLPRLQNGFPVRRVSRGEPSGDSSLAWKTLLVRPAPATTRPSQCSEGPGTEATSPLLSTEGDHCPATWRTLPGAREGLQVPAPQPPGAGLRITLFLVITRR